MAKGNFIDYVVSDDPNKYPNDGVQSGYYYETVEDATPEVTAQTPVITQIAENLGVTITTPSGTNKQILQGNNANLLNIKNNAKKEGLYVWKKLTADGGDFIDFVVSDSETAYPDGDVHTDGYWYEKVKGFEGFLEGDFSKFAVDKFTFAEDFACNSEGINGNVLFDHSLGVIPRMAILTGKNVTKNSKRYLLTAITLLRQTAYLTMHKTIGKSYSPDGDGFLVGMSNSVSTAESTAEKVAFDLNLTYLEAGKEYTLITLS